MIAQPHNRISQFLLDPTPTTTLAKKPRSDAQREASRRNGAKGRGPRSATGKARSAANSFKHGFFAKHLAPPCDRRELDELFQTIRAELVEEFQPRTFTKAALIDSLAADYVDLKRVRALVEALHTPVPVTPEEDESFQYVNRFRRELEQLEVAMAALKDGNAISPDLIGLLAKLLALEVSGLEGSVAPSDPNDPEGLEPLTDDELEPLVAILTALGPVRRRWVNPARVSEALQVLGKSKTTQRLLILLDHAANYRRQQLSFPRHDINNIKRRDDAQRMAHAQDPGRFLTLRVYQSRIEHAIDRKIRRLER